MDSASCSKDNENERKTYPIRKRIQTDKAVASIINWVDKDVDTLSDSDIRDLTHSRTFRRRRLKTQSRP